MAAMIRVKNWKKFQHYRQRNPPWIRLYNELLDNYDFARLQDASKWHACGLWLLASRFDNAIPNDPIWIAQRINARSPVDIAALVSAGFVEFYEDASVVLAECKQVATPETETETETEKSREEKKHISPDGGYTKEFLAFWAEYPKRAGGNDKGKAFGCWKARLKDGSTVDEMMAGVKRYTRFCFDTDKVGTEYVKQAATFLGRGKHFREDWTTPPRPGIAAGSEAARVRSELPQESIAGRSGKFSTVGGKVLETDEERDNKRVAEWRVQNEGEALKVWEACANRVAQLMATETRTAGVFSEVAAKAMLRSEFRNRVVKDHLTPRLSA